MIEEPRITAAVVFRGIVEKVEQAEPLDDLFVLNEVHFRVGSRPRPAFAASRRTTTDRL